MKKASGLSGERLKVHHGRDFFKKEVYIDVSDKSFLSLVFGAS